MATECLLDNKILSINLSEYKIYNNFELFSQCEICYNSKNCDLINILNATFRSTSVSQMLDYFPSIKEYRLIEYSFKMCLICIKQLICSYLFLEKLRKSNEKFKGLAKLGDKSKNEYRTVTENNDLSSKDISKSKDYDRIVEEGSIGTSNNCEGEQKDSLFVKHDHAYIPNSDDKDLKTSVEGTRDDVVENIQILIEANSDVQEKKFICDVCDTEFVHKQSLDYHIRRVHLNEKTLLCSTCGKQFFLQVDFKRHILLHKGESSHKCNLCKKGFVTSSLLKNHQKTVHKAKEIKCSQCPKMFKLQSQLKRHIMSVHNLLQEEESLKMIKEKADCNICGKKLNRYTLKTHMERHSGSKKYQCDICGQKFFQHLSLNNHMIRHQDPKFSCEYCAKPHFTKQEMLTHIRRQHTREIVCTCQHCGKGFVHQTNLIQHIRNCHPGENDDKFVEPKVPKQCTVCGKIYSSRTSLIHHRRRAHENKEYSCTECDMSFKNLVPLKSHLKKIHNIGDTYICDTCNKSFYTREDLYKHKKRTHTIGANSLYLCCTVCKIEKFRTKHELIQHMQEHLDDSTSGAPILYECTFCLTFFVNFEIFQTHLVKEHPDKTGYEIVIMEYEIGGCKVQYFNSKRNVENR